MAWSAWNCYPHVTMVTEAFTYMVLNPCVQLCVDAQHFRQLEHFTVILYDKTSHLENVGTEEKNYFAPKTKTMKQFHQHRIHCYSIQNVLLIKLHCERQVS